MVFGARTVDRAADSDEGRVSPDVFDARNTADSANNTGN